MKIKTFFETMYWFSRYLLVEIKEDLKSIFYKLKEIFLEEILTLRGYFYVLVLIAIWFLLRNPKSKAIFLILICIIIIIYKKIKTGDWKAYMRKIKGYG